MLFKAGMRLFVQCGSQGKCLPVQRGRVCALLSMTGGNGVRQCVLVHRGPDETAVAEPGLPVQASGSDGNYTALGVCEDFGGSGQLYRIRGIPGQDWQIWTGLLL